MSRQPTSPPEQTVLAVNSELVSASVVRPFLHVIGVLLLMLLGGVLLVGGLAAIVLVHTVGIGKLIGLMIVIGMGLLLSGWTTLRS